jgi:hypothetical protein
MMRVYSALAVAAILLLASAPSTVFPAVTRHGVEAKRKADDIATAITISAEQTRRQIERSEATIQVLYQRLETETAQKRAALRRVNLSERERRQIDAELGQLRQEQRALIAQLAAKDTEYAASIRAYREGLTGLLADNDPRVVTLLERYADGDARVADELQELTRIIRKARQTGILALSEEIRKKDGAEQRTVARIWLDEKDRGGKTTEQVLAAWEEAASIDSDDFTQWIHISRLRQETGDLAGARAAANEARLLLRVS